MAQGQHGGLADMLICDGLITCKCSKGPRRFQKRQFPAQPIRTQGDAKLRDAAQGAIGSLQICQSGARSNNARPQSGVFRLPMRNKGLMVILISVAALYDLNSFINISFLAISSPYLEDVKLIPAPKS